MPRQSEGPIRTCLGCMQRDVKRVMVRVGISGGRLALDPRAELAGRGGYLHPRAECLARFAGGKTRQVRSFLRRVTREERLTLVKEINARLDTRAALE